MCQLNEEINKPKRHRNIIKYEKEELEGLFQKENNNLQDLKGYQTEKEMLEWLFQMENNNLIGSYGSTPTIEEKSNTDLQTKLVATKELKQMEE